MQQAVQTWNFILCHKLTNESKRSQFHFPFPLRIGSYRQNAPHNKIVLDQSSPIQLYRICIILPFFFFLFLFFFPSYPNLLDIIFWKRSVLILFLYTLRVWRPIHFHWTRYALFFSTFYTQIQTVFFFWNLHESISLLELQVLMYCEWSPLQCREKCEGVNMPLNVFHTFKMKCLPDTLEYCQLNFKCQDPLWQ